MNTLSDLKKRIQTGIKIKLIDAFPKPHKYLGLVRTITKVQTNGFYMATDEQLAENKHGSWLDYPKAKGLEIGGNSFRIKDDFGVLDYELI